MRTLKPRMNYWWDFCPRLVHLGIWDDVYLEISGPVRIGDVLVRPQLASDFRRADVSVATDLDSVVSSSVDLEIILRYEGMVVAHQRTSHDLTLGQTQLERLLTLAKLAHVNLLRVWGGGLIEKESFYDLCDRLGVDVMRIWKEIQPGLPSCVSLNDPPRMLVLKSGSFGKPHFFERALEHLREP